MSAIHQPASERALSYWATLCKQLGDDPTSEVPETVQECSMAIDDLKMRIPASVGQVSLAEKLIGDHVPGKALPANPSSKLCSDLIENFSRRQPTKAMLVRLHDLEKQVEITNPNPPRTTKACYEREMAAKNLLGGGDLVGQLIDAKDAVRAEWGLVDAELAPATEYREDESEPETEGSSVYTSA